MKRGKIFEKSLMLLCPVLLLFSAGCSAGSYPASMEEISTAATEQGQKIVTVRLEKSKEDTEVSGLTGTVWTGNDKSTGMEVILPDLGFETDAVYYSAVLDSKGDDDSKIHLALNKETDPVVTTMESAAGQGLSYEQGVQALHESGYLSSRQISLVGNPAEYQEEQIFISISSDASSTQWIHELVNLIFYRDDEIVFADVMECNASGKKDSFEFVYTLPVTLPEGYDRVEVIRL